MNASDIMTKTPVTIAPNAPIVDALRLMLGQRLSGLPVVDMYGRVVGLLSEGDLLRRAELGTEKQRTGLQSFLRGSPGKAKDYVQSHARKVEEVMTRDVVTASQTTPLEEIVELMEQRHIKRVPIVHEERLVGVVSRADLLRALATELERHVPAATSDAALRKQVSAQLGTQPWCRGNRVDAVVADGVVFLEGFVFDESEHEAIRVAAENVPGVKMVQDHIEYINPNLAMAHVAYAHLLADLGRHEEAVAAAARARRLDPVSLIVNAIEGSVLYFAGRDELARARLEKTLELDPNFWIARLFLGKVLLETGNYEEAIAEFTRAREFSHGNSETISMLGYAWALAGDSAKARGLLAELKSLAAQRYIPPNSFAVVHLGLGEHDETFTWLEKAYVDRDVRLSFLRVDRKWAPLRSDPRFVALLKRVGLE
jgi:CBS domain-containing protein